MAEASFWFIKFGINSNFDPLAADLDLTQLNQVWVLPQCPTLYKTLFLNCALANPAVIRIAVTRWRPRWQHLGKDWWMTSLHCMIFEAATGLLESIFLATVGSTLGTTLETSVTFNSKSVISKLQRSTTMAADGWRSMDAES